MRDAFARDGSVVVRGAVPLDEIVAMRAVFAQLIPDGDYYPRGPDGVLYELPGLARMYPPLAAIAHDPRFGALVADALGARRVQLLQDTLLYKPARDGGSVAWHQDHTYLGYLDPPSVVSLRIALTVEDARSGAMHVVDGSHRWGPVGDVRALTESRVDSLAPALSAAQGDALAGARTLALAPGDVSIHHCLTLHGSGPNHADAARCTIILRMFDAACRLDPARLPPGAAAHFPTDADGHLDPAAFPVVFARA